MALSSCPIAFSNKSNVFTNAHRPAWVYVYTQGCRKPAMDRVYSSNNHGCTHFYSRFILAFLCTEKNMHIKIGNDSIRCVYMYIQYISRLFIRELKLLILGSELIPGQIGRGRILLSFCYLRMGVVIVSFDIRRVEGFDYWIFVEK